MSNARWCMPLLVSLIAVAGGGCGRSVPGPGVEAARPVKLALVAEKAEVITFSAAGRVEAARRAELSFERSDVLAELYATPGREVQQGEVLARLDARSLEIAAQARRARFEEARLQYERFQRLFEREAVAQADLDRAQANYNAAKSDLEQVEKDIEASALRAPFAGRIAATPAERFQLMQPRQTVAVLHDLSSYRIRIDLPERFILRAGKATNAQIRARFEHLPGHAFPAEVEEYATEANPDTLTYPAVFAMRAPEGQAILPGMSATLDLEIRDATESGRNCWVPEVAVFSEDGRRRSAWKVDAEAMRVHRQDVEVGETRGGDIQILSGLVPGDTVAVSGVHTLSEGQAVKPYEAAGQD